MLEEGAQVKHAKKPARTNGYMFYDVSKEDLNNIEELFRQAGAVFRPKLEGVVKRGLFNDDEYVKKLHLTVTDNDCEELLLYLEQPLERSCPALAPQIEEILEDYYERLYRKSDKLIAKLNEKFEKRTEARDNLLNMDNNAYRNYITLRKAALKRGSHESLQEHACESTSDRLNDILNYNPFAHLDPAKQSNPSAHSVKAAWRKYQELRLKFKRDLRKLGYSKAASNKAVDSIDVKYFHDNVVHIKSNLKKLLYERQGGYCNGCVNQFEERHLELDHIVPRAKGGPHTDGNLHLLCSSCNRIKGDRSMDYLLTKLKAVS